MQNTSPTNVWLFLAILSTSVNFAGCCSPARLAEGSRSNMQVLGQSGINEWETPGVQNSSEIVPKSKPRRNFFAPILTLLKRDTEEDYILAGKPISFAGSDMDSDTGSRWELPAEKIEPQNGKTTPSFQTISQVSYVSPSSTNNTTPAVSVAAQTAPQKKISLQPGDSQEIVNLITALNAHEPVDQSQTEYFLTELRNIDRSKIPPEIYQYSIDRIRSALIPAPPEPAGETAAEPQPPSRAQPPNRPQAASPGTLKKQPLSRDAEKAEKVEKLASSERLTKGVPQIEITEEKTGGKTTAPVPAPPVSETFAENRLEIGVAETDRADRDFARPTPQNQQNDIPFGNFANYEPINDSLPFPQVNPSGYNSRETFQYFEKNAHDSTNAWVSPPAAKHGEYVHVSYNTQPYNTQSYNTQPHNASPQDWEQATAFAIATLRNRVLQAPNQNVAATDKIRLQILETVLYGENVPVRDSRLHFSAHDESVQDFMTSELFAITTLLDEKNSPEFAVRLQAAQPHFQEAQRQLAKSCPLKIRNVQFIQNDNPANPQPGDFRGFGIYTPVKAEFTTDDWAWVYLEMENFVISGSEVVGFNTKFSISYEIHDASGHTILNKNLGLTEETTKSPRRDMALTVPLDLLSVPPGHYKAVIRVTDQNHIRLPMDTHRIDFVVRATASK